MNLFTIESTDWNTTNKTYTIEDNLITVGENESAQFISYNPALYDDARYEELCKAAIRINSVSNGQIVLKCTGILPTSTQYLMVTFKATYSPSIFTIDGAPIDGSQNPISSDGVYEAIDEIHEAIKVTTISESDGSGDLTVNRTNWKSVACTLTIAKGLALLSFNAQAAKSFSSGAQTLCTFSQNIINQLEPGYYVFIVNDNSGAKKRWY